MRQKATKIGPFSLKNRKIYFVLDINGVMFPTKTYSYFAWSYILFFFSGIRIREFFDDSCALGEIADKSTSNRRLKLLDGNSEYRRCRANHMNLWQVMNNIMHFRVSMFNLFDLKRLVYSKKGTYCQK